MYKLRMFSFKFEVATKKFKSIFVHFLRNICSIILHLQMNNFDLSHRYTIPRPSISVHYIPHTVQIQLMRMSPHAQPYTDNSHYH